VWGDKGLSFFIPSPIGFLFRSLLKGTRGSAISPPFGFLTDEF